MKHVFINQVGDTKTVYWPGEETEHLLNLQEAIANIMKHSNGDHVDVYCRTIKGQLKLMIKTMDMKNRPRTQKVRGLSNMGHEGKEKSKVNLMLVIMRLCGGTGCINRRNRTTIPKRKILKSCQKSKWQFFFSWGKAARLRFFNWLQSKDKI